MTGEIYSLDENGWKWTDSLWKALENWSWIESDGQDVGEKKDRHSQCCRSRR